MNKYNPTVAIVHDTRRMKKDGTYPVKLRVTQNKTQKYFKTKYSFSKEEYAKVISNRVKEKRLRDAKIWLQGLENKADEIIQRLPQFSFQLFEKRLKNNENDTTPNLFRDFEKKIKTLEDNGQIGTSESYRNALKSLQNYVRKSKLDYETITADWLKRYEQWMLDNNKSLSTVGIYLRYVRALFNDAIAENRTISDIYPFEKRKYQIPSASNYKQALTPQTLKKIYNYEPKPDTKEAFYYDLWIFSYLANGANMTDIANLKYKNIVGDKILFQRAKTIRTIRENKKQIIVQITDDLQQIIDRWGNKKREADEYIFPILVPMHTLKQHKAKIKQQNKMVGKYMRQIFDKLGIEEHISPKVARHSFSTMLMNAGYDKSYIQDALGHSSVQTTELYLAGLYDENRKKMAQTLTNFENLNED